MKIWAQFRSHFGLNIFSLSLNIFFSLQTTFSYHPLKTWSFKNSTGRVLCVLKICSQAKVWRCLRSWLDGSTSQSHFFRYLQAFCSVSTIQFYIDRLKHYWNVPPPKSWKRSAFQRCVTCCWILGMPSQISLKQHGRRVQVSLESRPDDTWTSVLKLVSSTSLRVHHCLIQFKMWRRTQVSEAEL